MNKNNIWENSKVKELKTNLEKLNGTNYTPNKLKKEIERIVKETMKAKDVPFNWYKFDVEDNYEFSSFFEIKGSGSDNFEIVADYSNEKCIVELRNEEY